jgi:hypothetical protein
VENHFYRVLRIVNLGLASASQRPKAAELESVERTNQQTQALRGD